MTRGTTRAGVVTIAAFLLLAWVSATWSPLGRGPVLDGLGPLAPYRWVRPPEGVPDEGAPLSASFELEIDDAGSEPDVLFTPDDQVTLVMDRGAVAPAPGLTSVVIDVTPLDPDILGPLPGGLSPFGNAVAIDAADVGSFDGQVDVILLYPETTTLHATDHEVLWSPDGEAWRRLDTTDTPATQQAQATLDAPGYVVVGAVPVPHPSASATEAGAGSERGSIAPLAVAVLGAALLVVAGVVARRRGRRSRGG